MAWTGAIVYLEQKEIDRGSQFNKCRPQTPFPFWLSKAPSFSIGHFLSWPNQIGLFGKIADCFVSRACSQETAQNQLHKKSLQGATAIDILSSLQMTCFDSDKGDHIDILTFIKTGISAYIKLHTMAINCHQYYVQWGKERWLHINDYFISVLLYDCYSVLICIWVKTW